MRPAAELGPIIVCLDTSGSMAGARETVAKVSESSPLLVPCAHRDIVGLLRHTGFEPPVG